MAENVYECMFILDSNRYSRDPSGVSSQLSETIEQHGGEILVSRLWDERRLAYPIEGHRKGTYWLTYFRIDSLQLVKLERQWQLNESVVRSLTLVVDPRIVEPLVAHANSSTGPAVAGERRSFDEDESEDVDGGVGLEDEVEV